MTKHGPLNDIVKCLRNVVNYRAEMAPYLPLFSLYGNIPYYSYILNSIEVLKACRFITYFLINEARSIGSYVIT